MKLNVDHSDWLEVWNIKYKSLIESANEENMKPKEKAFFINQGMLNWCEEMIEAAKESYYETDNPIMPDSFYDRLEDHLHRFRPESLILEKVGS